MYNTCLYWLIVFFFMASHDFWRMDSWNRVGSTFSMPSTSIFWGWFMQAMYDDFGDGINGINGVYHMTV